MKVAILGNTKLNYSWFVLTHRQGLKMNGHDVVEIDYKSNPLHVIYDRIVSEKPKYVFTHLSFHYHLHPVPVVLDLYKKISRACGTKFIHTLCDARHEPRYNGDISGAFHMAFLNQTENLEKFQNYWKIPVIYAPYCSLAQTELAKPLKELTFDDRLIFPGSPGAHTQRVNFLKQVQQILPLVYLKTQSANDMRHRTPELSISAKAILSACIGYDIAHYNEVRPWQYLGAGACLIHKKFKGEDDLIPDDLYFEYRSPKEVKEQYDRARSEDTMPMRKKAFEFMQKYHNSKIRMYNVIECLEERQNTTKSFLWEL
jgi:hypothetical protein